MSKLNTEDERPDWPERGRPQPGVHISAFGATIVFLTVTTKDRRRWLAADEVHVVLRDVWLEARAWMVGRYVLMPDHLHLFVSPGEREVEIENWVRYWKRLFTQRISSVPGRWQSNSWHHRLRRDESYAEKWDYVRYNPVRQGLVAEPDDWPDQGELHILRT